LSTRYWLSLCPGEAKARTARTQGARVSSVRAATYSPQDTRLVTVRVVLVGAVTSGCGWFSGLTLRRLVDRLVWLAKVVTPAAAEDLRRDLIGVWQPPG
jgi:hypothetical protein